MHAAVTALTREIMTLQAEGSYAKAKDLIDRLGVVRPAGAEGARQAHRGAGGHRAEVRDGRDAGCGARRDKSIGRSFAGSDQVVLQARAIVGQDGAVAEEAAQIVGAGRVLAQHRVGAPVADVRQRVRQTGLPQPPRERIAVERQRLEDPMSRSTPAQTVVSGNTRWNVRVMSR